MRLLRVRQGGGAPRHRTLIQSPRDPTPSSASLLFQEAMKVRSRINFRGQEPDRKRFTLVELLVVIVILGVLAAVVVFAVGGITNTSKQNACKIEVRTVNTALQAFYANSSRSVYPPASVRRCSRSSLRRSLSRREPVRRPTTTSPAPAYSLYDGHLLPPAASMSLLPIASGGERLLSRSRAVRTARRGANAHDAHRCERSTRSRSTSKR